MLRTLVAAFGMALLFAGTAPGRAPGTRWDQETQSGFCLLCSRRVEADAALVHRGRRVWLCEGECAEHWHADPEHHSAKLEPRGALFDESTTLADLVSGWMWFGVYVLVGLVSAGLAAYVAVGKQRAALPWFLARLFFNVLALIFLLGKSTGSDPALEGVPRGLRKVPVTYGPRACAACGHENHPSATRCSGCGADLDPSVESEIRRA